MKLNKDSFEVIFFARGGQGAKTATEILARAAIEEGKYAKAFPEFGPERSGAPIRTFLRVSESPIRTQETVTDPDVVIVLDDTVMAHSTVAKNLDRDESLIVNSRNGVEWVKEAVPHFQGKIYPIDATRLALEMTGKPNPNVVALGAVVKVTEIVKLETVMNKFREIFEEKLGKELTDKSVLAIQKSYDSL